MTMKVFDLEDVNRNMISNEHYYKHTISTPPSQKMPFLFFCINPVVEWYWKCLVSPLLLRFAAGAAAFMSVLIIWSEVRTHTWNSLVSGNILKVISFFR